MEQLADPWFRLWKRHYWHEMRPKSDKAFCGEFSQYNPVPGYEFMSIERSAHEPSHNLRCPKCVRSRALYDSHSPEAP